MWPTLKPSQRVSILDSVAPQSSSSVQATGWISAKGFLNFMALIDVGALGASSTVDAKIQQASDSSGTGAKDITGKALTQLTKVASNDNTQSIINLQQSDFDVNGGFNYFKLSVTPAVAACLIQALVLGFDPVEGFATDNDNASVLQVVG